MEKKNNHRFVFDMPGIVLIDEIETHLHLELQKHVMSFLTRTFPNIQFIVTTHSPFVLNDIENVVIYDLEKYMQVDDRLTNYTYSSIVEGYFSVDEKTVELNQKLEKYRQLIMQKELLNEDFAEIARLEVFLNEIPDFLAPEISAEYKILKAKFENREDI